MYHNMMYFSLRWLLIVDWWYAQYLSRACNHRSADRPTALWTVHWPKLNWYGFMFSDRFSLQELQLNKDTLPWLLSHTRQVCSLYCFTDCTNRLFTSSDCLPTLGIRSCSLLQHLTPIGYQGITSMLQIITEKYFFTGTTSACNESMSVHSSSSLTDIWLPNHQNLSYPVVSGGIQWETSSIIFRHCDRMPSADSRTSNCYCRATQPFHFSPTSKFLDIKLVFSKEGAYDTISVPSSLDMDPKLYTIQSYLEAGSKAALSLFRNGSASVRQAC